MPARKAATTSAALIAPNRRRSGGLRLEFMLLLPAAAREGRRTQPQGLNDLGSGALATGTSRSPDRTWALCARPLQSCALGGHRKPPADDLGQLPLGGLPLDPCTQ